MWKQWSQNKLLWRNSHEDCVVHPHPEQRQRRRRRTSSARASRASSCASAVVPYTGACQIETLPLDVVETVLAFLDHASLHAVELTSRFCVDAVRASDFWRSAIDDKLVCFDEAEDRSALWKRMHCMRQRRAGFTSDALLTGVVSSDTPNDFSVPPTWLLFKSRCWFWMEKLLSKTTERDTASLYVRQLHCGCGYHVPCFWSSSGSASSDQVSCIEFSARPHCFLTQIQLVPYQAYWIDGHPGFAPKQVSFTFLRRDGDQLRVFYESPAYAVQNEMTLHEFDLPKTVWTAESTVVRVKLIGRTQRAPLDERPWIPKNQSAFHNSESEEQAPEPEYYCCLSYVNAVGFVVQDASPKKARHWWHH